MQSIRRSLSAVLIACAMLGVAGFAATGHANAIRVVAEPPLPRPLTPSNMPPSSNGEPDAGSTKSVAQKVPVMSATTVRVLMSRPELRWLGLASMSRFLGMGL